MARGLEGKSGGGDEGDEAVDGGGPRMENTIGGTCGFHVLRVTKEKDQRCLVEFLSIVEQNIVHIKRPVYA